MLHGRESELVRCARLLDDARGGRAGALVVLGEPGVGKSALLDVVTAHAEQFRVLRGLLCLPDRTRPELTRQGHAVAAARCPGRQTLPACSTTRMRASGAG